MRFRVGPFEYRVQRVAGALVLDGEACLGLCDNEAQVLYVSEVCSPAQRVQVLCHEYMEAWWYHFGQTASDKEGWCDLFGLAMTQFVTDLLVAGGLDASLLWEGDGATASAGAGPAMGAVTISEAVGDSFMPPMDSQPASRVGVRLVSDRIVVCRPEAEGMEALGSDTARALTDNDRWRVRVFGPQEDEKPG